MELVELAGLPSWLLRSAVMMGFKSLAPLRLFLLPLPLALDVAEGGPWPGLSGPDCCFDFGTVFMAVGFLMSEPFMIGTEGSGRKRRLAVKTNEAGPVCRGASLRLSAMGSVLASVGLGQPIVAVCA
jgi:hypothetical protein